MAEEMMPRPGAYALVHLVAQEADKDLIGSQVLDHAAAQLDADHPDAPDIAVAAFLEPVRHAISTRVRDRMRQHAARHPGVRTVVLPYASRLGRKHNGRLLAYRLRSITGTRPIVLHCRGESAVDWATALAPFLGSCAIIADIRGAWPEELLFARGFDGRESADSASRAVYDDAMARLRAALGASDAVVSVSPGMLQWLRDAGTPDDRLTYVPCCVTGTSFDDEARTRTRERLGLHGRLVFCYLGTITPYQHVADGVLPFFRAAAAEAGDAHLLCITPDASAMNSLVKEAAIPAGRVTVVSAGQREVAEYLAAADAGFLLRAPSRLNRFSQPTKLGEYLAAGVPVIVARGTGAVDALIEREQAGAVVTAFGLTDDELRTEARELCDGLRSRGEVWRENALGLCRREFTWSGYGSVVRETYVRALRNRLDTTRERSA